MVDIILLNLGWNTDFVKHLRLYNKKTCLFKSEEKCKRIRKSYEMPTPSLKKEMASTLIYIYISFFTLNLESEKGRAQRRPPSPLVSQNGLAPP